MPGWWKSLQNDYLDNAVLYIVLFIRVLKTLVPDLWRDMLWRDIQVHMHLSGWYFLKFHCASESHSTKYWEKNLAVPDPSSNFHSKQCNKWQTCQTRWVGGIPTARVCRSVITVSPVMLLQMEELHPAPFLLQCLVKQSYHCSGGRWERFLQQRDSGKGEVNASSHWLYQANHRTVFLFLCKNMYKKKKCWTDGGRGGEKSEKLQCEHQNQRRRERRRCPRYWSWHSLQPVKRTMVKQAFPCSAWRDSTLEQMDTSWRNCNLWRAHTGAEIYLKDFSWWVRQHWKRGSCEKEG